MSRRKNQLRRFNLSSKIKGIFRVSGANIFSLFVSLLTSFLLPYFISVEDYGYWQLFVLYAGYAGFFAFGFNDGVHLNYATYSYEKTTAKKFKSFLSLMFILSLLETILLSFVLIVFLSKYEAKFYVYLFTILSIIPTIICGLFTYLNQATLRFKEYSWGLIVDKIVFAVIMLFLLVFGCRNYRVFIGAYIFSRYIVIIYHFFSSKMVFIEKGESYKKLRPEIKMNFVSGFALMIATILNNSIIVGSRLLIENRFGIEDFSAYSFSIHTLVVASQFITAIASVFYPIMKRCGESELPNIYNTFDQSSSLLSSILLLSYYPAAIIICLIYKKYFCILDYLFFVYSLFIFQCKSNLLVINTFKVRNSPVKLIVLNLLGIFIHVLFAFISYMLFGTIKSIAISVLLSYALWYYISQMIIYKTQKWIIPRTLFGDLNFVLVFLLCNLISRRLMNGNQIRLIVFSFFLYLFALLLIIFFRKAYFRSVVNKTAKFLND